MSSEDLKDCSLHSWRYCVLGEGDLAAEPLYQSSESWRWSREKYFKRLVPTPFFWIAAPPRHSVLGIPIPKSLAFWASPSHITAAFWASPGTLPGCPNRQCFGHPLQRNAGFRGKIENVLETASAKYRNLFQYLEKKAYPEGFTKQKNDSAKFAKKFEYDSKLESLFQVAKEKDGTALR